MNELLMGCKQCKPVLNLGLPDRFIEQGTQDGSTPCWGWTAWAFRPPIELAAGLAKELQVIKRGALWPMLFR